MDITFDPEKRRSTLETRGVDFADAWQAFEGPSLTVEDDRFAYPEPRFQTFGFMNNRLVIVVWTPADAGIRVISMRKCNEREQKTFARRMG